MAIYIDIVTGFLESGKTSFIKDIIQRNCLMEYKKTVLIVCEEGTVTYEEELLTNYGIELLVVNDSAQINQEFFQKIEVSYSPEYIIMEHNGTWDIVTLLNLKLPFTYQYRNVIFISEAKTFDFYINNMAAILLPQLLNSDIVVFNRGETLDQKEVRRLKKKVHEVNGRTEVSFYNEAGLGDIINRYFAAHEKYRKISIGTRIVVVLLLSSIFMSKQILSNWYHLIQSISTIFLSILIEAIPFVLLGSVVSSLLQLYLPSGWLMNRFSQNKYSSLFYASIAGFFMPICDCGTVPLVSGLIKKGIGLPQTMTFWLASSAVNPVVLISVYYAFPDHPFLVALRLGSGLLIAMVTGVILKVCRVETKQVICDLTQTKKLGNNLIEFSAQGQIGRLEVILKGARFEFFRVMKYLIFGAFVSALFQNTLPQLLGANISHNIALQIIMMIVAAILMSTCSTANAFIGRSFLRSFQMIPIMSYIVLGPMLDIKNMLMLSEVIKKRYLVLLAFMVALLGYILFLGLSLYFK